MRARREYWLDPPQPAPDDCPEPDEHPHDCPCGQPDEDDIRDTYLDHLETR